MKAFLPKNSGVVFEQYLVSVLACILFIILGASNAFGPAHRYAASAYSSSTVEQPTFPEAKERDPRRTLWVVATAYSSEAAQTDDTPCIPADGLDLCIEYEEKKIQNAIAANFLPLGTTVKFPEAYGDKEFIVRDRMNARYNGTNRIDFWLPEKQLAVAHGVQYLEMEIY